MMNELCFALDRYAEPAVKVLAQDSNSPEDTFPGQIILTLSPKCCVLSGEVCPDESSAIEASTQSIITPRW